MEEVSDVKISINSPACSNSNGDVNIIPNMTQLNQTNDDDGTPDELINGNATSHTFNRGTSSKIYSKLPQVTAVLVACLGSTVCGFVRGYSALAIPDLQRSHAEGGLSLTMDQISWFASSMAVGALFGCWLAAFTVDKLGRKATMVICCGPFSIGWFLIIYSNTFAVILLGRILTGFGMGLCTLAVSLYISESTSKDIRGRLSACYQMTVTFGVLCAIASGLLVNYQWIAVIASIITTALVLLMPLLPETPRWFMKHGKRNGALNSLKWLYSGNIENMDPTEMEGLLEIQVESVTIIQFFKESTLYKPLMLSTGLMIFQQFNGINAVLFYLETILDTAGFDKVGEYPTLAVAILQFATTILSFTLVDKAGRKALLIAAGILTSLTCFSLGAYFFLTVKLKVTSTLWYMRALSVSSIGIYMAAFSIGWGPVPWIIMAEIFPIKARGVSSGIVTSVHWICILIITKLFPHLLILISPYGTFWMMGFINVLSVVFVVLLLPETKGKSLEEIEMLFDHQQ